MFRSHTGFSVWFAACALASAGSSRAAAEDVYFHRTVSELTITEGKLPKDADQNRQNLVIGANGRLQSAADVPRVAIEGAGEAYLDPANTRLDRLNAGDVVAFRVPDRREIRGRLFAPKGDGPGMVLVAFKTNPPQAQEDAKAVFGRAKRRHYERLMNDNVPGRAWFAHRAHEADSLVKPPAGAAANARRRAGATDLDRTFSLFSGGRAVDENLQIDRPITPQERPGNGPHKADEPVKTDALRGITVAEIDWAAKVKGKDPELETIAAAIPADQHALFFPDLKAVAAVLATSQGGTIPVLNLLTASTEDRGIQRRYERQLGVSLADLGRLAGRVGIRSLALTGSDPYFPSGTDLAVLIETDSPDELLALLKSKLDDARRANSEASDDGGEIDGVRYAGARTPDRSLSAYVAVVERVVVVTNSRAQLGRLVSTARGKTPMLAGLPEYHFFRDRYARGGPDESAFLVLSDATIRRWCGPRWRIGSSRRTRAADAMGEVQAENLAAIANEKTRGVTPQAPSGPIDLGKLHLDRSGVRSEIYGTLDFQTPIVELPLSEVERDEADAYGRWRDGYQQNWRGVFDPIAARLTVRPDRLAADVTVMPLIVSSEYRSFVELAGAARLAPDSGDRHPGSLVHAVMALDLQSKPILSGGVLISSLTKIPQQVALGWLGSSASLYLDDDPFWADVASAKNPAEFLSGNFNRLPLGVQAEVTNGAKLALFLTGLRAFIEQSAPNITTWENREHKGQRYVRIAETEGARPRGPRNDGPKFALHYYASPRSLTLSLNEDLIKRVIDRQTDKADADKGLAPWLGESLALRVDRRGFEALGTAGQTTYRDQIQARSWDNLPILNEWKRLFPDRDPVALHREVWGSTPVDPGGGRYVWNETWATMESTVFGHPGEPKSGHETNNPLSRFGSASLGLSFEDGGLRARTDVEMLTKP